MLGSQFRNVMYPRYGPAGGGLLRLHSTYRHDLKIYSSDEGRVQTSAAAFTQGLLDLEGTSLTPILVRYTCDAWAFTEGGLSCQIVKKDVLLAGCWSVAEMSLSLGQMDGFWFLSSIALVSVQYSICSCCAQGGLSSDAECCFL